MAGDAILQRRALQVESCVRAASLRCVLGFDKAVAFQQARGPLRWLHASRGIRS